MLPAEYLDPIRFFANTYPTRGLKSLLHSACARLAGRPEQIGAIFRLDTQFGGGKTHALIALAHAVRCGNSVRGIGEFVEPTPLSASELRMAAFGGENADPANGRRMSDTIRAFTPVG